MGRYQKQLKLWEKLLKKLEFMITKKSLKDEMMFDYRGSKEVCRKNIS